MKKIIATLALLAATTAPALADDCFLYNTQINGIASSLNYENSNMVRYTAMIEAATSVNDFQSAKMYASMGKDTAIRITGLSAEFKSIIADIRKTPGMCGAGEADIATAEKNMFIMDKSIDEALKVYANLPQ